MDTGKTPKNSGFKMVSLRDEKLSQRITLTIGFMAFIPVLILTLAFLTIVFPHLPAVQQELLKVYMVGAILSIIVGYIVLKNTVSGIMNVVQQARDIAQKQLGESPSDGNEIGELTKTFNRITQELELKIEELEASQRLVKQLLERIGTAMNTAGGVDDLYTLILEHAAFAMLADIACIVVLQPETQTFEIKAKWSKSGEALAEEPESLRKGPLHWVFENMKPMRLRDRLAVVGLGTKEDRLGAILAVPMAVRHKAVGILCVFRAESMRSFNDDEEILLSSISAQLAAAEENNRLNRDVERTYIETITALALAVEAKDPYSAGHSKRVGYYAEKMAQIMGLDAETCRLIREGGVLHDVGKIGIKDAILLKPAPLDEQEQAIMRQHPVIGEAILKPLQSMRRVAEMVRHHHERYDGGGYPDRLKGEQIPLTARILLVADAYDSMITDRTYRKKLTIEVAKNELQRGAGYHFDPQVVEAALVMIEARETGKDINLGGDGRDEPWGPFQQSLYGKLPKKPLPPVVDDARD